MNNEEYEKLVKLSNEIHNKTISEEGYIPINLNDYDEIEFTETWLSLRYHPDSHEVQLIIEENTDLIQEEYGPMLCDFGCILLRKKKENK